MIWSFQIDGNQRQDRPQEALRLAQRQIEDEPKSQRRLDRLIRELPLSPRPPDGADLHAAIASAASCSVMSPRCTSARSYSAQLPTRYFVLYFGCTRELMPGAWPKAIIATRWRTAGLRLMHRHPSRTPLNDPFLSFFIHFILFFMIVKTTVAPTARESPDEHQAARSTHCKAK